MSIKVSKYIEENEIEIESVKSLMSTIEKLQRSTEKIYKICEIHSISYTEGASPPREEIEALLHSFREILFTAEKSSLEYHKLFLRNSEENSEEEH